MARWDERDHPRDEDGRFRDKTGAWVTAVSDAIGTRQTGHTPARGVDLTEAPHVPWDELGAQVRDQSGDKFVERDPDHALDAIYEMQGYHGRPRVASRTEMDELVGSGWVEIWRGHAGSNTTIQEAQQRAEDYRSGDRHRAGRGIFGNGSYFGALSEARNYAKFDHVRYREVYPGTNPEQADAEDLAFDDPDSPYWAGLTRAVLPPDARVIDVADAKQFYLETIGPELDLSASDPRAGMSSRGWTLADLGRASALRGYDAIRVPASYGAGRGGDFYVVLNRSILVVQEG
jgi:hypothetical protein